MGGKLLSAVLGYLFPGLQINGELVPAKFLELVVAVVLGQQPLQLRFYLR